MSENNRYQEAIKNIPVELMSSNNLGLLISYKNNEKGDVLISNVGWIDRGKVEILNSVGKVVVGWGDRILPGDFQNQWDIPFGESKMTIGTAMSEGKELFLGARQNNEGKQVPAVFYVEKKQEDIKDEWGR